MWRPNLSIWYHGNYVYGHGCQLPLMSIKLIHHKQLFASKLAIEIHLKVLYMNVSGRTNILLQYFCMMPKTKLILNSVRHHAHYRSSIKNKASSTKFGCSPMVSNLLSHVWLFSLAFFFSTSAQKVLTRTVDSNRVQRSLAAEAQPLNGI